jgi:uncharacterized radical SAM superfamily protein
LEDACLGTTAKETTIKDLASKVETDFERSLETAKETSWARFGKRIRFYAPTFAPYSSADTAYSPSTFPSVSVTGKYCALNCLHCEGRLLNTMIPVSSPRNLVVLARDLKEKGSLGFLLSGGCLPDGSVPVGRFLDSIKKIKRELQLTVFVHTGLIDFETAKRMRRSGVDGALIDVIGSNETIKEVYNLEGVTTQDFERSLEALHRSEIPTIPHILVGLHHGKINGEYQALGMISKHPPSALVIIALRPIRGTPMEAVSPPTPRDIGKFIVVARLTLKQTPIVLGCVRPLGRHKAKTDRLAVLAGINGIAFPSAEALKTAKTLGLETSFSRYCCARIFLDEGLDLKCH